VLHEVVTGQVPFDAELAVAIHDRSHQYGAAAIDQHIKNLTELRADLLDGRLPVRQPETDPDREAAR
jgi:hypothetical protein